MAPLSGVQAPRLIDVMAPDASWVWLMVQDPVHTSASDYGVYMVMDILSNGYSSSSSDPWSGYSFPDSADMPTTATGMFWSKVLYDGSGTYMTPWSNNPQDATGGTVSVNYYG